MKFIKVYFRLMLMLTVMLSHTPKSLGSEDLSYGVDGADAVENLQKLANYMMAACKASCEYYGQNVKYLNWAQLMTLQSEYNLIGFVGRSKDYDLNNELDFKEMEKTRLQILSILAQLDPKTDILVGGATDTGFNKLLARLGATQGFQVFGLTSMASAKYAPMPMHSVYIDHGNQFGTESQMLITIVKAIFALEGGNQSATEVALALQLKKPTYVIKVSDSLSIVKRTLKNLLKLYELGSEAVFDYNKTREAFGINEEFSTVVNKINYFNKDMLKAFLNNRKLIGVTSYSENGPTDPGGKEKSQHFSVEFIDNLVGQEKNIVIGVSGSNSGAESEIAKYAKEKGFTVIALAAAEINPSNLLTNLDGIFIVSQSWKGRIASFVSSVDAIVSYGGHGLTVYEQIKEAIRLKKPWIQITGIFPTIDAALHQHSTNLFEKGHDASIFLLEKLNLQYNSIHNCKNIFKTQ